MATIKLNSHTGCRLITLSAIDVDISNMSFTTEKKDKDASTESQDMESQNVLTDNVNWGYAFTEKGYKYSTFCYADSLMLAHDLNVGIDVDYKIKENFLNYAKDILKTKSGKPYIYSSGYVKAGALEFTQEYGKYINKILKISAPLPISKASFDDKNAARYGVGISADKVHKVVYDFYTKAVNFNPWTISEWSYDYTYGPKVRLKYYRE